MTASACAKFELRMKFPPDPSLLSFFMPELNFEAMGKQVINDMIGSLPDVDHKGFKDQMISRVSDKQTEFFNKADPSALVKDVGEGIKNTGKGIANTVESRPNPIDIRADTERLANNAIYKLFMNPSEDVSTQDQNRMTKAPLLHWTLNYALDDHLKNIMQVGSKKLIARVSLIQNHVLELETMRQVQEEWIGQLSSAIDSVNQCRLGSAYMPWTFEKGLTAIRKKNIPSEWAAQKSKNFPLSESLGADMSLRNRLMPLPMSGIAALSNVDTIMNTVDIPGMIN